MSLKYCCGLAALPLGSLYLHRCVAALPLGLYKVQLHSLWGGSAVGVAILAPNGSAMCCIMFAVVFARTHSSLFYIRWRVATGSASGRAH